MSKVRADLKARQGRSPAATKLVQAFGGLGPNIYDCLEFKLDKRTSRYTREFAFSLLGLATSGIAFRVWMPVQVNRASCSYTGLTVVRLAATKLANTTMNTVQAVDHKS